MSIVSRPYKPEMACCRCVFNTGEHAPWCDVPIRFMGMTVILDPTMEPGTIRFENADGDCLGTIINCGPWADLFAQPKEKP